MSRFWLLQRVRYHPTPGSRFWSDAPSRLSPEYMGSAEFEFGAMPASLNRLIPVADSLVFEQTTFRGTSFDIVRTPADTQAAAQLAAFLEAGLDPARHGPVTKEWPWAFFKRLEGRMDPTPPPGRGGKEHQRKMYSWKSEWEESGMLLWDLSADTFFSFTPGQGPDGQPVEGVAGVFLTEIRSVAATRRDKS